MFRSIRWRNSILIGFLILSWHGFPDRTSAAPLPGGTLDPTSIPKYVTPLLIPPQMPKSTNSPTPAADYDIAVRQFRQQILPGGIFGSSFPNPAGGAPVGPFPTTTVWSYGRAQDPVPDSTALGGGVGIAPARNSSFNYPALTIENSFASPTTVRWINDLVDPASGNYLPHLFPVDQSLHWANPPRANCAMGDPERTDCETMVPAPYTGPVPMVTHVHGSHVQPHSDGYPQAWWLPGAPGTRGIPASYGERGSAFTQADNSNTFPGSAFYRYDNSQPASTLWYHDHTLGMTRLNVYAGPAGFWLIRGGANDLAQGILPGPGPSSGDDPNFNAATRRNIREIPIVIQDRSFNSDGSLFYPAGRDFFDGFTGPFIGTMAPGEYSDISGIWNPEAFFNTMVVNGTTWPKLDVAAAYYRFRLLNGSNSRTLNLSLRLVTSLGTDSVAGTADDVLGAEIPFYQIGCDQGFLAKVVKIEKGFATTLPGNGTIPASAPASNPDQALLLGPAERADVIVCFCDMANGTRVRMLNTAPDAPFGGFPDIPADPLTTGQIMDFVVDTSYAKPGDDTITRPENLVLPKEPSMGAGTNTRMVSLNELMSDQVCVELDTHGAIVGTLFTRPPADPTFMNDCLTATPVTPGNTTDIMGPRQARLGVMTVDPITGTLLPRSNKWGDPVSEYPLLNSTEIWEIYNTTVDAHPIHLHLVRFELLNRQDLDPSTLQPAPGTLVAAPPNERGYKDTVLAYPGQVTRIKAKFDIAGRYVWHCHIVEHEDNEMMRPFIVTAPATGVTAFPDLASPQTAGTPVTVTAAGQGGSGIYEYRFWINSGSGYKVAQNYSQLNSFVWKPSTAGAYDILVDVRSAGSSVVRDAFTKIFYYQIRTMAASGVTLTSDLASPRPAGTPITFAAVGQGGSGSYEYRFWINSGKGYAIVRDYGAANTYTWTPQSTGAYDILVDVRNAGSSAMRHASTKIFYYRILPAAAAASGVTLTPNLASPRTVGSPITFTATGQGGSGSYEYRFWLNSGSGYTIVQDYGHQNTYVWTPTATGAYDILVDVRNAGSKFFREAFTKVLFYQIR